jgi:hypothetical protein
MFEIVPLTEVIRMQCGDAAKKIHGDTAEVQEPSEARMGKRHRLVSSEENTRARMKACWSWKRD